MFRLQRIGLSLVKIRPHPHPEGTRLSWPRYALGEGSDYFHVRWCAKLLAPVLILTASMLSLPAVSQAPAAGAQAVSPRKAAPEVQALLEAGHKAQDSTPPNLEKADRLYNLALSQARKLHDKTGEGKSLQNLGNNSAVQKQAAKAIGYYQQAVAIFRETNDNKGEGDTFYNIALTYSKIEPDKTEGMFQQARSCYHKAGDTISEARTLTKIGNFNQTQGHIRRAREAYTEAATFAHSVGNEKSEADAIWYRGSLFSYEQLRDADRPTLDEATEDFLKAAALYHKVSDFADEAWTDILLGGITYFQGHLDENRSYFEKALSLYRRLKDIKSVANTLRELGNLAGSQGRLIEALNLNQEALDLYKKIGDKPSQGVLMLSMASHYRLIGQPEAAIQYDLKALPLLEKSNDIFNRVNALVDVQYYYWRSGNHTRAQAYLDELIPLLQSPATGFGKIREMDLLANIYIQKKDYTKAKEIWEAVLPLEKEAGLSNAGTFGMLSSVEGQLGHLDKELEYLRREIDLIDGSTPNLAKAQLINRLAEIEEEHGNLSGAEQHLIETIALLEQVRSSLGGLTQAKSTFLSWQFLPYQQYLSLLLQLKKPDEAFALAQKMKARSLLDILNDGKVQLAGSLSQEERQQEKLLRQKSDALNYQLVKEGVQNEIGSRKRAENIKLQLTAAERDLQVFEDSLYASHPDIAEKRAAKTVTLEDVAKFLPEDTALLEYVTLKVGKTDETVLFVVTQQAGSPVLSTHILPIAQKTLVHQIDALRYACTDPRKPYRAAAATLYQSLIAPVKMRLAGKKRLLVCPDGVLWDVPFAALMSHDDSNSSSAGEATRFLIEQFEIAYAYSATGAQAELTAQARGNRRPTKTMLAFADPSFGGELRFGDHLPGERPIPSASRPIPSSSRPIPSASRPIHAASRPIPSASRLIPAASRPIPSASRPIPSASRDPLQLLRGGYLAQLPGTLQEARAIRADFKDAVIYTKEAAQEAVAKREAGSYRYLHFATHGFFNDAAPLLSAIVLALPDKKSGDDGFLTAREIFDLNLSADLVVLSACNTARGEKRSGEGMIGLTWALFAAGAPTQVVSQWSVNDASTALLMQHFYANLTQGHMAKGEALRQAELSLLNNNRNAHAHHQAGSAPEIENRKYAHPYYWAPFILLGNWGK